MAFETEPTFQRLNVGSGLVRVHSGERVVLTTACQFAAFGPKDFGNKPAPIAHAVPSEADRPLERPLDGAIALVRRGQCSFEAKMRAAAAAGASGVILMNDEDATFLAAPDPPPSVGGPPPSLGGEKLGGGNGDSAAPPACPLVVVSASAAARITAAYAAEQATGATEVAVSVTALSSDESLATALRLPLFPVVSTSPGSRTAWVHPHASDLSVSILASLTLGS